MEGTHTYTCLVVCPISRTSPMDYSSEAWQLTCGGWCMARFNSWKLRFSKLGSEQLASSLHLPSPFHIIICWHVWLKRHVRIGSCQGCVLENACPYHNRIWLWGCKATNYQVSCSLKEAILTGASITGKESICFVL